ncbi:hypothetical protein GCM10010400_40040 [Streptomyces aculeolatus]|uniref:hypothetical protein n=1 Tax=Streptomyces aculeolatus TaxID=270689 RepID=UPI001CEDEABE|nr:hypothetical protein [Streptomyces aculeolatus]
MGYRKTTRRLRISLQDHKEYGVVDDGEEAPLAYARGKSLEEYLVLEGLSDSDDGDTRSVLVRQMEEFGDSLISWNLEDEGGKPLPCNRKALFGIDNDLAIALATEWMEILGGKVDAPLADSSPSGGPSPVASIPTETLSEPLPPTSVPA